MPTIEAIRKEKGYTQEMMAAAVGVAISTYNQYETGARNIPYNAALKICTLLNVDLNTFFLPTKFTLSKNELSE